MPIVNYERVFEKAKERFLRDDSVSLKNKKHVELFLNKYGVEGVSPSRKTIFLRHIVYLLRLTKDIAKDMGDRGKINSYFSTIGNMKLKSGRNMGAATYQTVINVSNALVRWLNGGQKPKGFVDIKNNKRVKRDLSPNDMITWEDAKEMIGATTDIQMQAIITTQVEAGLRPSEFIDLKYGDIEFNGGGICKVNVKGSKTDCSRRIRHLYRATPYLQKWVREHPLKKKNSPLWIKMRCESKNGIKSIVHNPYGYRAMSLRVIELGKKAGIEKPLDFYNLRHSAVVMSKTDGLPDSIAMKEFGHATTRMYSEVYGRLSDEDQRRAIEKIHGIDSKEVEIEKNMVCKVCKYTNTPECDHCENCNHPLSAKAIEELKSAERKREEQLHEIKDVIKRELIKEIMEEMKGSQMVQKR